MDMLSQLLRQAALQEKSPMEQFTQMFEDAKRNAAAEQSAPALPMKYVDPLFSSSFQKIQRDQFENRSKGTDSMYRQTYIGTATKFSSTSLYDLQPVRLNEMKIRKHHKGRFLLCRITAPPSRIICVSFTVEDLNGWSQIVSVYNFPGTFQASGEELDTIFPLNSVLAIREPTAKMALAGNHSHIRIDSPSDIIFLEPNDPILEGASWATGSKAPHMATASEKGWKAVGDDHFKRKQFFGAAVAYSKALKKDPSSVVIRLNRCITHIRLTNFAFAAHDAQIILSNEALDRADRIKALYRAALALYGSRKYKEAGNYYQACLAIEPGLKEASTGLDECRARIREEEHGIYDWKKLFNQGEAPCARPDVADYTGPVKVSSVPHRGGGRGVVAIKDIKPGELLFVSKAFAASFPPEVDQGGRIIAINFLTNRSESGTQYALLQQLIAKVAASDHVSTPLLELYAGDNNSQTVATSRTAEDQESFGNPLRFSSDIDTNRIESIISFNSFTLQTFSKVVEFKMIPQSEEDTLMNTSTALYAYPSFINHSCVGNATWITFGHVMVIRAVTHIATGEEITMSYYGSDAPYPERTKALSKYFKHCDCALCVSDRAAGPGVHEALAKAEVKTQDPRSLSLQALRQIANKVDAIYPISYGAYRPTSYGVHHRLAHQLQLAVNQANNELSYRRLCLESVQHEIIALEALGLHVIDKETTTVRPSRKTQMRLPVKLICIHYDPSKVGMTFWMIVGCFLTMHNEWRAEMWLRVALWFEDKFFGGGIPLFRIRYSKIMKGLGPEFEALLDKVERQEQRLA